MKIVRNRRVVKAMACYLAVALFVIGVVEKSYAGFSPSETLNLPSFERATDLKMVQNLLETKVVMERLRQLGFNKDEIQTRLDQLSDQQLHRIALKADELKVGSDGGFVIAVLLIAILVLLIVYLVPVRR
jgi:hypothetical protein